MKILLPLCARGLMVVAIFTGSCPGEPPFPGGIRVTALEAPAEAPSATLGVPEVGDFGNLNLIVGPGNGSEETFVGFTSVNGIDDHPNARTNANWTVTVDYTTSPVPQCGFAAQSHLVPVGGSEFKATCLL